MNRDAKTLKKSDYWIYFRKQAGIFGEQSNGWEKNFKWIEFGSQWGYLVVVMSVIQEQ